MLLDFCHSEYRTELYVLAIDDGCLDPENTETVIDPDINCALNKLHVLHLYLGSIATGTPAYVIAAQTRYDTYANDSTTIDVADGRQKRSYLRIKDQPLDSAYRFQAVDTLLAQGFVDPMTASIINGLDVNELEQYETSALDLRFLATRHD